MPFSLLKALSNQKCHMSERSGSFSKAFTRSISDIPVWLATGIQGLSMTLLSLFKVTLNAHLSRGIEWSNSDFWNAGEPDEGAFIAPAIGRLPKVEAF